MFCVNCGREIEQTDKYCHNCGFLNKYYLQPGKDDPQKLTQSSSDSVEETDTPKDKIITSIPELNDIELGKMLNNCQDHLEEGKNIEIAQRRIEAILEEWKKRKESAKFGTYKADTPEEGLLSVLGYHVGQQGEKKEKRHRILDYVISGELPPVGSPAYMFEWGEAKSRKRFLKLRTVLKRLFFKAKGFNWEKAMIEWDADLEYIEKKWKNSCN